MPVAGKNCAGNYEKKRNQTPIDYTTKNGQEMCFQIPRHANQTRVINTPFR
jgi:hypothetical protein